MIDSEIHSSLAVERFLMICVVLVFVERVWEQPFCILFFFVNNNLLLEVSKEVKSGVFVKSLFSTLLV